MPLLECTLKQIPEQRLQRMLSELFAQEERFPHMSGERRVRTARQGKLANLIKESVTSTACRFATGIVHRHGPDRGRDVPVPAPLQLLHALDGVDTAFLRLVQPLSRLLQAHGDDRQLLDQLPHAIHVPADAVVGAASTHAIPQQLDPLLIARDLNHGPGEGGGIVGTAPVGVAEEVFEGKCEQAIHVDRGCRRSAWLPEHPECFRKDGHEADAILTGAIPLRGVEPLAAGARSSHRVASLLARVQPLPKLEQEEQRCKRRFKLIAGSVPLLVEIPEDAEQRLVQAAQVTLQSRRELDSHCNIPPRPRASAGPPPLPGSGSCDSHSLAKSLHSSSSRARPLRVSEPSAFCASSMASFCFCLEPCWTAASTSFTTALSLSNSASERCVCLRGAAL
eukprot:1051191-Prymnesium_polylepis.2